MENILEIKNLSKDYSRFKLDNVSLNLKKGYIMGFIGPNGSGKTTTIKLIMNLIKRSSGVFSEEKTKLEDTYRIIKGGLDILGSNLDEFISVIKNKYGFSGLTTNYNKLYEKYGSEIVIDKPNIEEIMIYMAGDNK